MNALVIGTILYHPCSIDILEYSVVEVHISENVVQYTLTNAKPVGIYNRTELSVIVAHNSHDQLMYIDIESDSDSYHSGLQDFVEGQYYVEQKHARKAYRQNILYMLQEKRDNAKRLYDLAEYAVGAMIRSIASIDD